MSIRIGDCGQSVGPLKPSGKVLIAGVRHDARSDGDLIDPDCPVVVVGNDRFGLLVRASEQIGSLDQLPRYGEKVLLPGELSTNREKQRDEQILRDQRRTRKRALCLTILGAVVGFVLAVALMLQNWAELRWSLQSGFNLLFGAGGGATLALWIDRFSSDSGCHIAALSLLGTVVGIGIAFSCPEIGDFRRLCIIFGPGFLLPFLAMMLEGLNSLEG